MDRRQPLEARRRLVLSAIEQNEFREWGGRFVLLERVAVLFIVGEDAREFAV